MTLEQRIEDLTYKNNMRLIKYLKSLDDFGRKYEPFVGLKEGLVPSAEEVEEKNLHFLRADGEWAKVETDFDVDDIIEWVWRQIRDTILPEGYTSMLTEDNKLFVDNDDKLFLTVTQEG